MSVDLSQMSAEERAALIEQAKELDAKEREERKQAYEQMKTDAIVGLITVAKDINERLTEFKQHSFETMDTLYDLLKEYSGRHAGGKGNFSVEFETQAMRVLRSLSFPYWNAKRANLTPITFRSSTSTRASLPTQIFPRRVSYSVRAISITTPRIISASMKRISTASGRIYCYNFQQFKQFG